MLSRCKTKLAVACLTLLSTLAAVTFPAMADEQPSDSAANASGQEFAEASRDSVAMRAERLIDALGSPEFTTREAAAAELMTMGATARDALAGALRHRDLEVQLRARQILARIRDGEFQQRIARFLSEVGSDTEYDLPGWTYYREIVGDERETREFFASMLEDESDVLESVERELATLGSVISERAKWFQSRSARGGYQAAEVNTSNMGALLLAGCRLQQIGDDQSSPQPQNQLVSSQLYSLLNNSNARGAVLGGRGSKQVQMLLETWIRTSSGTTTAYYGLNLTLQYGLKEVGREIALKSLDNGSLPSSIASHAVTVLGRFGTAADIPTLEKRFQDETVCHTWSNRRIQKEPIRIQTRDVALAMAVHLSKQDIKEYGYEFANPNTQTVYDIYTLGFLSDKKREAAFAMWKTWRDKQAK